VGLEAEVQRIRLRLLPRYQSVRWTPNGNEFNVVTGFTSEEIKRWSITHFKPGGVVHSGGLLFFQR